MTQQNEDVREDGMRCRKRGPDPSERRRAPGILAMNGLRAAGKRSGGHLELGQELHKRFLQEDVDKLPYVSVLRGNSDIWENVWGLN